MATGSAIKGVKLPAAILGSICLAIVASYVLLWFADRPLLKILGEEDGPVETVGAFLYLAASIFFLYAYARSSQYQNWFFSRKTKRNVYFLLLGALCLMAFGEEISWGQRIFGWATPEPLEAVNVQGETNIHNLWLMQRTEESTFLQLLVNPQRLLNILCALYTIILPVLYANWQRGRELVNRTGVPVPSATVGLVFAVNYLALKGAEFALSSGFLPLDRAAYEAFDELSETNTGAAFVVLAATFLAAVLARKQERPAMTTGAPAGGVDSANSTRQQAREPVGTE